MFVSCGPFERRENYRIDKQLNETSELHFFGDNCQNDYKSNVSNNNEINKTKTPHKRRQRKLKLINFSNVKIIDIKTIFFSFSAKYTEIQYPWLGNVTRHFRVNSLFVFRNATSLCRIGRDSNYSVSSTLTFRYYKASKLDSYTPEIPFIESHELSIK